MDAQARYTELSLKTAANLKTIAQSELIQKLSTLTLPEIEAVVDLVAKVIPAGNVPGVILNGLARLPERKPPLKTLKRDINLLFTAIEQSLDKAVYSAFFAGPAAVIWGYQNLLKLAGKDPDDSFPHGLWQFYADYALREDTARHANETHGFDTVLNRNGIQLSPADRVTAWVMAAIHCLHNYDALLRNEWRERVYIALLRELSKDEPEAGRYAQLYQEWSKQRPYGRGPDAAPDQSYPLYRRLKFDRFLEEAMSSLRPDLRQEWVKRARFAKAESLPAYQQQMSILAYLEPGPYGETRQKIPLKEAHIGLIHEHQYYLLPASATDSVQPNPPDVATVRLEITALLNSPLDAPEVNLTPLATIRRTAWPDLYRNLSQTLVTELERLRLAPIWINCGPRPAQLPLIDLRQAERGIGDHPLTLFDSGETMVFDQSHIFFDGAWGAALAEIMTQEALAWGVYLNRRPPVLPERTRSFALTFSIQSSDQELLRQAPQVTPEVGTETTNVDLKAIQRLRRLFKRRNDLLCLTVNDLLVLYRAIHAATYQPSSDLIAALNRLSQSSTTRPAALAALTAIDSTRQVNPPIVIPVDASQRSPRDRLYPMTLTVPLNDLDLLALHKRVIDALDAYRGKESGAKAEYDEFDRLQRTYLSTLAGFGEVMSRAKELAQLGESDEMLTMRLLANLPTPLQRMLDAVPTRFEVLNDVIKGREVFSNVGAVVPTSTLLRFMTAKDDNDRKTLAWGVITDAQGVMHISLRDFRPHVALLAKVGHRDLAVKIAQDYVDAYTRGLNNFVEDLQRITETSRETRLEKAEMSDV